MKVVIMDSDLTYIHQLGDMEIEEILKLLSLIKTQGAELSDFPYRYYKAFYEVSLNEFHVVLRPVTGTNVFNIKEVQDGGF
jgi:hypothetical protein